MSLVLLLRQRGQLTAGELAKELEVSVRTVLRDIDALSTAGVPVYADRGRHGGFSLLPGFRTELTGLSNDEALALLTAGSIRGEQVFGLGSALSAAILKVVDALPESSRGDLGNAASRLLLDPEADLLPRRSSQETVAAATLSEVRRAVLTGHKLRINYGAPDTAPRWHTIDPIGLVTARDRIYLIATKSGEDRTYRLSRMLAAETLPLLAERTNQIDLERIWADRCAQFLADDHLSTIIRVRSNHRDALIDTARALRGEERHSDDWVRLTLTFDDLRHALWAVWQLDVDVEVIEPASLRTAIAERAATLADRYR